MIYMVKFIKKSKSKIIKIDEIAYEFENYAKLKNTEIRYMPKNMKTPAAVDIYGNNVGVLILKPKPIIFLISSKEAADSYREFFKLFWKICNK